MRSGEAAIKFARLEQVTVMQCFSSCAGFRYTGLSVKLPEFGYTMKSIFPHLRLGLNYFSQTDGNLIYMDPYCIGNPKRGPVSY